MPPTFGVNGLSNLFRHFIGPYRSKLYYTTLVVMKITKPAEFRQLSTIEA